MNAPARHVFPYEKLDVWQDARVLIGEVYQTTKRFPSTEKFSIVSQINRAAVSVACNLAEGSARTSYKDQAHFSQIAYSSLMELSCLLTISQDLGFISQETALSLADKIAPLSSRINKLRQVQLKRERTNLQFNISTPQQFNPVYSGTQVVVTQPILGTNKAVIHPRGAVGVVTRTPCCEGEKHYLVRFPDGFEASLTIDQMEVLKHFKDRMTESDDDNAGSDFDLESCIVLRCVIGSSAYGLDTEESDTDFRGVYLAPAHLQWSLYGAPDQFEDNQTQSCYWEVQKFLVMALKANPNILECLYSPLVDRVSPIGEQLLSIRDRFLSQMIFQTFSGYALSQFKKIEQDVRNHGFVKWKHAMHLLRLLMVGTNALRDGTLNNHAGAMRERL